MTTNLFILLIMYQFKEKFRITLKFNILLIINRFQGNKKLIFLIRYEKRIDYVPVESVDQYVDYVPF